MNAKNTVFVNLPHPNPIPTYEAGLRQWQSAAVGIVADIPTMEPKPETPTIEELFEKALPVHIEGSRWGRYIAPGPASRVSTTGTIFQYHDPCKNFWDLYELSKGIFRDLGIRLSRPNGAWIAHIPIRILIDTVFVDSGLAAVERTLLAHTGINAAKMPTTSVSGSFKRHRMRFAGEVPSEKNRLMYRFIERASAERYIQRFGGKIWRDINGYTLLVSSFRQPVAFVRD